MKKLAKSRKPIPVRAITEEQVAQSIAQAQIPAPVVELPDPATDPVPGLLEEAMRCHYRAMAPGRNQRRNTWWLDDLHSAAVARSSAAQADPNFLSPAWAAEDRITPLGINTHAAFMAFYQSKGVI